MLPPSLPPITDTDLELLDALRLERFRSRFGQTLLNANLYISGLDRALIISGGRETGALRYRTLDLLQQSWQVCGCTWVKVYALKELILNCSSTYNKLGQNISGEQSMATAIQEEVMLHADDNELAVDSARTLSDGSRQTLSSAPEQPAEARTKIIRSMALTDIAADLEAEPSALQAFLEERSCTLIDFGGTILVPENQAIIAYEHYSLIRARQKMDERFALMSAIQPDHQENNFPTASKETKPKKNYLTWKREFKVNKSSYKKTLQNALNALFPDAPNDQDLALSDIISQSDMGKAYLDKILRDPTYTDKVRAREQLLKAATELAAAPQQGSAEEEEDTVLEVPSSARKLS